MQHDNAKKLLERYRQGKCSEEERALLEDWYLRYLQENEGPAPDEQVLKERLDRIQSTLPVSVHRRRLRTVFSRVAAIAAFLVLGTTLGIFIYLKQAKLNGNTAEQQGSTGTKHSGVYIVLDDGERISVGEQGAGKIFEKGQTSVSKADGHKLVYETNKNGITPENKGSFLYNTVVIPKGIQYQLVLADGTKVWLNAQSSLRFPTRFSDTERYVEISGEAYFEVAKDNDRPFRVRSGEQTIEVLGTHFNLQAYDNEPAIKTTLLEGSVRISLSSDDAHSKAITEVLLPGEQAQVSKESRKIHVEAVDARSAIHWKNGVVTFKNADLATILRQVSRWYDVEIEYEGPVPDRHFTGGISISAPLSDFLKILKLNHIQFQKKSDKLIINPIQN